LDIFISNLLACSVAFRNANLLDELSNKLQQKEKYFVSLYSNIRAKVYQDLGFRPLTVDTVEVNIIRIIKHGLIMIFVMTLSRIICHLFPTDCFLGCLLSLLYKDFCIIIILINYLICQYFIRSRDAAGRLTGHIVGNGLSTEQDYSPASGHLYTIKSNFNSVEAWLG
jgi:hypothetical protein